MGPKASSMIAHLQCQLLGAIIHQTHGEDYYIIDKFPKAT